MNWKYRQDWFGDNVLEVDENGIERPLPFWVKNASNTWWENIDCRACDDEILTCTYTISQRILEHNYEKCFRLPLDLAATVPIDPDTVNREILDQQIRTTPDWMGRIHTVPLYLDLLYKRPCITTTDLELYS